MSDKHCVLQDLAQKMAHDPALKAVWLDAKQKRVSFALNPGTESAAATTEIREFVARYQPGEIPDCAGDSWDTVCEMCDRGSRPAMPPGIHLLPMPGAGVLLERESCPTAPLLWRWTQIPWVKLQPRVLPLPSELPIKGWKAELAVAVLCGVGGLCGFIVEKLVSAQDGTAAGLAPLAIGFYLLAYVAGSWHPAKEVIELIRKRILDVHFLMFVD